MGRNYLVNSLQSFAQGSENNNALTNKESVETRQALATSDGLILTNAHVIEGTEEIELTFRDRRIFKREVIGTDPLTEVRVIKIEARELPVVKIAGFDKLQPGEYAIAIGNPLGLDNTVTTGIINATGRSNAQVSVGDK